MKSDSIAIIGMACHYPGAQDLRSFWENILTKRRQFRRIPDTRLSLADYYDPDPTAPDKTYCNKAGLIDNFSFDLVQHRIPRSSFESTDIVHWLALKVALASIEDAGFNKNSVPSERSGVILGNTLTGEHSRSEGLRLRWPFVRRVLSAAAQKKGFSKVQTAELLITAEEYYKSVFVPITEDTLAGALSNTIAGRICNHLDFHGGGYTVDGACSSSVIAAATAATALSRGDLDLALAGGVDISLDTFELVGFAKTAALTRSDMRVYDRRGDGFIPGEGCGFVVMKRLRDALADQDSIYAVLRGWGISSDGKGGLTAPNAQGQARALRRAYESLDYTINDLDFIEGHGTGTAMGDKAELEAVALAMDSGTTTHSPLRRCGITSLKSIIGHTKAASGVAALIKAVIAVNRRVLPPFANCSEPHPAFTNKATALYPVLTGEIRQDQEIMRAGISGMGFGGINSHLTIESADTPSAKLAPVLCEQKLLVAHQTTEIFIFKASTISKLLDKVRESRDLSLNMCEGEMADFAAHLIRPDGEEKAGEFVRAAIVANSPVSLVDRLVQVEKILQQSPPEAQQTIIDNQQGIYVGHDVHQHKVGFLFPGQGSQQLNMARRLVLRHDWAQEIVASAEKNLGRPATENLTNCMFKTLEKAKNISMVNAWRDMLTQTETAQPAICLASVLWLEKLTRLGIKPDAVGGHSLGELTAFYAAGAYSKEDLIKFAAFRGRAMASEADEAGTMASLACSPDTAQAILDATDSYAVIANKNSSSQIVISGEISCIEQACALAKKQEIASHFLPVSNAFHSKFVAQAAQQLAESRIIPQRAEKMTLPLFTGIEGREVKTDLDVIKHFSDQVISPVNFVALIQGMRNKCDLMLEVGPGRILTGLANSINAEATDENTSISPVCFSVEAKAEQDKDLNLFLAIYFVHGGQVNWEALYEDRLIRPFKPASERVFLTNPCEKPFPVPPADSTSSTSDFTPELLSEHTGHTDFLLAEAAGVSPEILSAYLAKRNKFLGGIIKVDLDCMSADDLSLETSPPSVATDHAEADYPREKVAISRLFLELIEQRTGFPQESLSLEFRLLDDLNLDSIKASELIAEAATKVGVVAAKMDVAEYANARLSEIVEALETLAQKKDQDAEGTAEPPTSKYPLWVRDFTIYHMPEPLFEDSTAKMKKRGLGQHEKILILFEPAECDLAEHIKRSFSSPSVTAETVLFEDIRTTPDSFVDRFNTVIALLPRQAASKTTNIATGDGEEIIEHVVRLHTIFSTDFLGDELTDNNGTSMLAVVQFGGGFFGTGPVVANITQCASKALAASLHLEHPKLKVRVLDFCPEILADQLSARIITELSTADKFCAVGYDANLIRRIPRPVLRNIAEYVPRHISWAAKDVILVTGGAKGVTAECALAFARTAPVQMALIGSSPMPDLNDQQSEIAGTLQRFKEDGLSALYYQCDITDSDAVKKIVRQVRASQGEITGVIHGSALNRPGELDSVSVRQALDEVGPKLSGAINLCGALRDHPPKIFAAFSSITGVSGMIRNGWYGFSNEAMHLIMQQYGATFPETSVLTIAFSIWDEVGMGVRMGSTAWLGKMGVAAIPVQQGTAHFLRLITHDPGDSQVVVAARTSDLDTFASVPDPTSNNLPNDLQFIEKIIEYSRGIEITSRASLTLDRDTYIKDHIWRGTYLFPMVFGLEAMAQAVQAVTGISNFDSVCIENIELERPIALTEGTAIEIEIHAQVLELDDKEAAPKVHVQIRAEQTNFAVDHFSATFVLTADRPPEQEALPMQSIPLDISPNLDLYNEKLLFQGPMFQRIQQIFYLTSKECLFKASAYSEAPEVRDQLWHIGDPFFRDSLLQSGQISIPKDLCLPRRITSIERFPVRIERDTLLWGRITIERRTDKDISGTVTVFNDKGQVVERIKGYLAKIIEHKEDNPTAEEMAHPGKRDWLIIQNAIKKRSRSVHFIFPEINSNFIPNLKQFNKRERQQQELPLLTNVISRVLNDSDIPPEVGWSDEGKPYVAFPPDTEINISLTHNQGTLICTAGQYPQGCDLESISIRNKDEWIALLGKKNARLLDRLMNKGDSLDRAGTRIWTASEAIFKALGVRPDIDIVSTEKNGANDTILFTCSQNHPVCQMFTFPINLTLKGERMLAVAGRPDNNDSKNSHKISHFGNTDSEKKANFTHEFTTTFMESKGAGGKVYFTNIPIWMGELRELALLPISESLLEDMTSRQWGMVTNISSFSIEQYMDSYDTVIGEVFPMGDTNLSESFISLAFHWLKKHKDGSSVRIASGKLSTTWVSIEGYGIVKKAPLPKYFSNYIKELISQTPSSQINHPEPFKENRSINAKMVSVFASDITNRKQYFLDKQMLHTSMEDSNLVGNIYFSNYYSWQARIRDHYLFTLFPNIFQQNDTGEFTCVHAEVHHLQEAMPFEIIVVSMYLKELFEEGFTLYFEYHSMGEQGRKKKLAHGVHTAAWTSGNLQRTTISPTKMPKKITAAFRAMIDKKK